MARWQSRELAASGTGDATWPQSELVRSANAGPDGVVLEGLLAAWSLKLAPPAIRPIPTNTTTMPIANHAVDDWTWVEAERGWIGIARDGSAWERRGDELARRSRPPRGFAPRHDHATVWEPERGRAAVIGGYLIGTAASMCADTWTWTPADGLRPLATTGRPPRFMVTSACRHDGAIVAVGISARSPRTLITARLVGSQWERLDEVAREYGGQYVFSYRECMFMLGADLHQLWIWRGAWRRHAILGGLAGNCRLALWLDPRGDRLWGYGRLHRRSTGLAWLELAALARDPVRSRRRAQPSRR